MQISCLMMCFFLSRISFHSSFFSFPSHWKTFVKRPKSSSFLFFYFNYFIVDESNVELKKKSNQWIFVRSCVKRHVRHIIADAIAHIQLKIRWTSARPNLRPNQFNIRTRIFFSLLSIFFAPISFLSARRPSE